MTTQDAIDYFDGSINKLAGFLDVHTGTIHAWGERPPPGRQFELEVRTDGAIKADRENLAA
jgi:hypothetical protein